jgi:hypothetical protein
MQNDVRFNMRDFMATQIEIAERMFNMMAEDHSERIEAMRMWMDVNTSLVRKLEERDKLIDELRAELRQYKTADKL